MVISMRKEIDIDKFDRKFELNNYMNRTNPFAIVTIKLDITKIVDYCKIHRNHYATLGYIFGKVANEMDCFKYRLEDGKLYKYDNVRIGYTNTNGDNNIGFYVIDYNKDFNKYIEKYNEIYTSFKNNTLMQKDENHGEIWVSCEPWFEFLQCVPPFDSSITIPQFIWSKFYKENNKTYTNLMIMVHHGFADGKHIGECIDKINEIIENFEQ